MTRTSILFTPLLLSISFLIGCGGPSRPADLPRLYPVSLTVIQEGEPLAGATVQLFPEDPALAQWSPMGITDASGTVALKTNAIYNGAPLGSYKITVSKIELEPHPNPEWGLDDNHPNYMRYLQIERNLKLYSYVESLYGSIENTPLRVEVMPRQKNYTVDAGEKIRVVIPRIII